MGGEGKDIATDIAVDDTGHAYMTGTTRSLAFPIVQALQSQLNGNKDSFVVKLSPTGDSLVYATYFGGTGDDGGVFVLTAKIGRNHPHGLQWRGRPTARSTG